MIKLPDFKKALDYENNFYMSCEPNRISKILAHYELYKISKDVPGAIVECGVFKGTSLTRFAIFRELFGNHSSKKIIGFDVFGKFPKATFNDDQKARRKFMKASGGEGLSREQLLKILKNKGVDKSVELVKGNVTRTVPAYLKKHPELKISLLNLDTDIYEPAVTVLEKLYPRVSKGGVILLDNYGLFPGETKAIDDYFKGENVKIQKFSFAMTPCYIIK